MVQNEGIEGEGKAGDMRCRRDSNQRDTNRINTQDRYDIRNLTYTILQHLSDIPHRTYFSHSSNSVYVYFYDRRLGMLTIRDHGRCKNHRIRWVVQVGYSGRRRVNFRGSERWCYNEYKIMDCVRDIRREWGRW